MKLLLLLALSCAAAKAQTLTFSIHDNSGATPDAPLPAAYPFASTPVGGSANILVKATNSGSNPIEVALIYIGSEPGTSTATPNFTVTGLDQGHILAPAASEYFTLNFTPGATGQLLGYLQVAYLVQQTAVPLTAPPLPPAVAEQPPPYPPSKAQLPPPNFCLRTTPAQATPCSSQARHSASISAA